MATSPPDGQGAEGGMITATETGHVYHVTGDKPRVIDEDLSKAVESAQRRPTKARRRGILVTRSAPGSFSVEVSADVPGGVMRESCEIGIPYP
jgi:hypothetical protein